MSAEIFRISESELDRALAEARPDLERLGITVADGSARDALVWAMSFSYERQLGEMKQRIATTLSVNGDAPPTMQTIAVTGSITFRDQKTLAWSELRQRGLADVIEKRLAEAQIALQTRIGVEFAHDEFIRRCGVLTDLVTDDIPNAAALREQIAAWRAQAEARTLFSPSRRTLIDTFDFGHVSDDVASLNEFYANNIYTPSMPGELKPRANLPLIEPRPAPVEPAEHSRRLAILDRIEAPKARDEAPPAAMHSIGIVLLVVAMLVIAGGAWSRNWWTLGAGAAFFLLAVRAMFRWRG